MLAAVALALSGCATKYQDMGVTGGVAAQQMTANTYRIMARGNGYTSGTTVQDYMMLKAAETTKVAGGSHFVVITAADASSQNFVTTPGSAQTTLVGRTAYTTYNPAMVHSIMKPGQDAYIRVITVPKGSSPPPGSISADEIIQFVGRRVERG